MIPFKPVLFQIWSALDEQDYLMATRHFLLSRHIHTSLQLESQQTGNLLTLFPVLTRQWAAISHFRTTILQVWNYTVDPFFCCWVLTQITIIFQIFQPYFFIHLVFSSNFYQGCRSVLKQPAAKDEVTHCLC